MAAHEATVSSASAVPRRAGASRPRQRLTVGRKMTPVTRASRDSLSGEGGVKFLIRQHIHPVPSGGSDGEDVCREGYTKAAGPAVRDCRRVQPINCLPPNEQVSFSFPQRFRVASDPRKPRGRPVVRIRGAAGARDGRGLRGRRQRQQRYLVESRRSGGRAVPRCRHRLGEPGRRTPDCPASRTGVWSFSLSTPPLGLSYYRLKITEIRPSPATGPAEADREDRAAGVGLRSLSISQFGATVLHTITTGVTAGATVKYLRGTVRVRGIRPG